MTDQPVSSAAPPYRVLARKYRPATFRDLIGQEAMVRTLTNAVAAGRLAHAFILTGVRGIGKTTTARIIARGLNCVGPDGAGGVTAEPCGVCEHCRAIAEDRHVDVLEMDAASRTGVGDIRELIDGVRYRPVSARYKVYIIDEVHMLSPQAFNALLKTLEEPPAHVKFIFATTEIRKIPVTVLSRCQRFDLRRVDMDGLVRHLAGVAAAEGVAAAPAALALIARAADGSVRDALSLLDQAIALAEGEIGEAQVRDMLGLADRAQIFDLFDLLMRGEAGAALDLAAEMYAAGADPAVLLQDLLELTHWLTRVKVAPQAGEGPTVPETERVRGRAMAERLSLGVLTRTWQLLLKGLGEVQAASAPLPAAEMVLIRLIHAAEMPTPAELVARLTGPGGGASGAGQPAPTAEARGPSVAAGPEAGPDRPRAALAGGGAVTAPQPQPQPAAPQPQSFAEVVALCGERREAILQAHLRNNLHLVQFEPGRIEIRPGEHAPANLANRLGAALSQWTGRRWIVAVSGAAGDPTLGEQAAAAARAERAEIAAHPLVRAVLASFPGATIEAVRGFGPASAPDIDPGEGGDGA